MTQPLRLSLSHWFFLGASLLGACALPGDEAPAPAGDSLAEAAQGLRAGQAQGRLTVELSTDKAVVGAQEAATVTVTLRNDSRHPVQVLRWFTPDADVEEPLFQVLRDGVAVDFTGPHYKRPAPRDTDFVRLAPGERLTRTVALSDFYDVSRTGHYTVRYQVQSRQLHGAKQGGQLESNEVGLWIEGRASKQPGDGDGGTPEAGGISFSGRCSSTQQATLVEAVGAASTMSNDSAAYLSGTPGATQRYTTWFGAYSSAGWSTAQTHFASIKAAFDTQPLTLDCGCKKNYYAYVYPNQPYKIYVCSAFWSAPMTGTDSKGGTLVHEMSHFTVVAGTDDYAYGQSAAKNLALTDPAKALSNADNHEYFAENTPYLQ